MQRMTHTEWKAEATRRFGDDPLKWSFVCPSCGHIASVADWRAAGAPEGAVAFSCIGRFKDENTDVKASAFKHSGGPCNYTGGGLFKLNPVEVDFEDGSEHRQTFAFGETQITTATN